MRLICLVLLLVGTACSGQSGSASGDGEPAPAPADGGASADAPVAESAADGGSIGGYCDLAADCDDGTSCTTDACEDGVCMRYSQTACAWPAEDAASGTNLTDVAGDLQCFLGYPLQENDFSGNLSGASWNPVSRTLWLVKNGPGTLFAIVEDDGEFRFAEQNGNIANWQVPGIGDVEGVTQVDFNEEHIVYVIDEAHGKIRRYDTSDFNNVVQTRVWGPLPGLGGEGGEGLAFVPDEFLAAQGFVDATGAPYTSVKGMGGLMFVAHQSGGYLHVYDLNPSDSEDFVYVGKYATGGHESAGLEFDRSAGVLHIWHDADIDELELVSLSSSPQGDVRVMDTITTYSGPELTLEMSSNLEGVALAPLAECVDGKRRLWLVTDGGDCIALVMFAEFPC